MTFEGTLTYLGWCGDWTIGDEHVRQTVLKWFAAKNASQEPVRWDGAPERLEVFTDATSGSTIRYTPELPHEAPPGSYAAIILDKNRHGFSNLTAYLQFAAHALNSRRVILDIEPSGLRLSLAAHDDVHVVERRSGSNSGRVSPDEFKAVCGAGTDDCCIFLTASSEGFSCEKFEGDMTEHLLLKRSSMNAQRIGNCKLAPMRRSNTKETDRAVA